MVQQLTPDIVPDVVYPDSDGQPMSDKTEQFRWIVIIKENKERQRYQDLLVRLQARGIDPENL
jgi:hypothetical protein